jgi:hypothetical protein
MSYLKSIKSIESMHARAVESSLETVFNHESSLLELKSRITFSLFSFSLSFFVLNFSFDHFYHEYNFIIKPQIQICNELTSKLILLFYQIYLFLSFSHLHFHVTLFSFKGSSVLQNRIINKINNSKHGNNPESNFSTILIIK